MYSRFYHQIVKSFIKYATFLSVKNSYEVINKLKSRGFHAASLSTYNFSTLYATLPHNRIKDK